MNLNEVQCSLEPADQQALVSAVRLLEEPGFGARLADMAGQPVGSLMNRLPRAVTSRLQDVVNIAMLQSLKLALSTLDVESVVDDNGGQRPTPSGWFPKLLAGITGGIGGMFGLTSLAFEIPITTTLMLRTIAEIAQSEGENLRRARPKLACMEVLALGARGSEPGPDLGYYASRAMIAQAVNEAATYLLERGVVEQAAPVLMRLAAYLTSRFGVVVSEKLAAGAVPVIGALGGATVNIVFMDHFQNVARGHFIIRRLERKYGKQKIRSLYSGSVAQLPGRGTAPRLLPPGP